MRRARRRIGISYASHVQKSRSSSGFSQTTGKFGGAGIGPCCFMMVPPVYRTGLLVSLDGDAGIQARLVERGDRTALEQVQEISGEGRLDVHRPAHLLI